MRTALLSAVFAIALSFVADGTDYGKPLPVTRIAGLKRCKAVAVAGKWLYAAGDCSLVTYRIGKNPLVPEETARTPLAGARQIAVSERFLFVSARHFGIFVFDRSDPARPVPVTRIDPVELATGIAVAGNVLFVSLRVYGVELIDVSDPKNPRHLSLLRNCGEIQSLFNFGNGLLAMGDWGGKQLRIADVRNPRKPVEISAPTWMATATAFMYREITAMRQPGIIPANAIRRNVTEKGMDWRFSTFPIRNIPCGPAGSNSRRITNSATISGRYGSRTVPHTRATLTTERLSWTSAIPGIRNVPDALSFRR